MSDGAELDKGQQRSFTSDKLDWMNAVSSDPRLNARAFQVGFCIAQHVNQKTRVAILSDDTICDKTGIPKRWVLRARMLLREVGWINWERTKTANVYWTLDGPMNAIRDHQTLLKEARDERKTKARLARQVTPPMAHLKHQEMPPMAHLQTPTEANRVSPPVANIHLSNYTVEDITP